MRTVMVDKSISLDGFIAGPKDDRQPDRELAGLDRLHDWKFRGKSGSEVEASEEAYFKTKGAVIMGHRTFKLGLGPWGENPTFHAPCFVVAHAAQEKIVKAGGTSYTFVTGGIESALEKARAAAGEKDIVVMGANIAQQYIKAGLLDEIHLQIVPILLGEGIRLFENLDTEPIELEKISVSEAGGVTHFRYRLVR